MGAPFIKVEATKYTEVGYVGRDVESMIRDLVECSVRLVKEEQFEKVQSKAEKVAEDRLVRILVEVRKAEKGETPDDLFREQIAEKYRKGYFDNETVEIEVEDAPKPMELVPGSGTEINIGNIFGDFLPKKRKKRRLALKDARTMIVDEECNRLIDNDAVIAEAVRRAEQEGIIFIDEIDKIAAKGKTGGADVSREGVQRDILPIVEGSTVMTKYGAVKSDFILFIAAGAFHVSKVSDLIPELQGRFPILVELNSLTKQDFIDILTTPQNAITLQYATLLAVDHIDLKFTDEAIAEIAAVAENMNATSEDIGARRLHTVMERLIEDISFNASDKTPETEVIIDKKYVISRLGEAEKQKDFTKFIL